MNVSFLIAEFAKQQPQKKAVVYPLRYDASGKRLYEHYTFFQLEERIQSIAKAFLKQGIKPESKVLMFVKPCLDLSAITFALFRIGAVPILIDPGMGVKNLLRAIAEVRPEALVAIKKVHLLKKVFRKTFASIKISIASDALWGMSQLDKLVQKSSAQELKEFHPEGDELAAILFTSGGTGKPKGVEYTHKIFWTQTHLLQKMFALTPSDVDCPGFPLFSLFSMALGMTSCIPDMDPTKPALVDPQKMVEVINDHQATFIAGSPAIWERVGEYCVKQGIQLPSVRVVAMFGAPVRNHVHELFQKILPNGNTYTPYGATESLPVSCIDGKTVLKETAELSAQGKGTCIGLPIESVRVAIIARTSQALDTVESLACNEIGEIVVSGDMVTYAYHNESNATKLAKIDDAQKGFWHRIGDMGYLDEEGRLWFLGRKAHVVEALGRVFYPIPCEAVFNLHPEIKRSALTSYVNKRGERVPVLCVERKDHGTNMNNAFEAELAQIASRYDHTQELREFYLFPAFPVDIRHNIKIDRKKLGDWVQKRF